MEGRARHRHLSIPGVDCTGVTTVALPVRRRGQCCGVELPAERGWAEERAALLKALADPTRLLMAACLWRAEAPICICDFTASLDLGQPTISHHMAKLKAAGLVRARREGVWIYYSLREDLSPETRRL